MSLSGFSSPEARLVPRALCPLIAWGRLLPLLFALLCGCAALPEWRFDAAQVPSLQYDGRVYTVGDARAQVQTPDLLALNDEMREFVALHTSHSSNSRNRLLALHSAIKSPGILDMQYDPYAEGDARTVFARGRANCLSYAHLFVAMARESGLDARYQWMEIRPEWQRIGERVAVRLHVNVHVRAGGEEYVIDIDPLNRHDVAGTRQISDRDARALFHNNNAMMALADERTAEAWLQLVKALELAPGISHLWVNLGAIYRFSGQYDAAEKAYFRALSVDDGDRSAMNNLAVLYGVSGRQEEREYWLDRLKRYRGRNPYYHSNLGDLAAEKNDWDAAYAHYKRAVRLQPNDSELVYGLGLVEYRRGHFSEASRLINNAIEAASFRADVANYRLQLKEIEEERSASL